MVYSPVRLGLAIDILYDTVAEQEPGIPDAQLVFEMRSNIRRAVDILEDFKRNAYPETLAGGTSRTSNGCFGERLLDNELKISRVLFKRLSGRQDFNLSVMSYQKLFQLCDEASPFEYISARDVEPGRELINQIVHDEYSVHILNSKGPDPFRPGNLLMVCNPDLKMSVQPEELICVLKKRENHATDK